MHVISAWVNVCVGMCAWYVTKRGPELESQSIDALRPNVLGFLSACNRILNGMSVWWVFNLVSSVSLHWGSLVLSSSGTGSWKNLFYAKKQQNSPKTKQRHSLWETPVLRHCSTCAVNDSDKACFTLFGYKSVSFPAPHVLTSRISIDPSSSHPLTYRFP